MSLISVVRAGEPSVRLLKTDVVTPLASLQVVSWSGDIQLGRKMHGCGEDLNISWCQLASARFIWLYLLTRAASSVDYTGIVIVASVQRRQEGVHDITINAFQAHMTRRDPSNEINISHQGETDIDLHLFIIGCEQRYPCAYGLSRKCVRLFCASVRSFVGYALCQISK